MSDVYVAGKRISLDPTRAIGKGGEADVYDIGGGLAVKIFKPPSHPDYLGQPHEQRAAEERIATHQQKLKAFPANLPPRVVKPVDLATDRTGSRILGYALKLVSPAEVLLRYADKPFREAGVSNGTVMEIFRDLHATVSGTHHAGVVIGDFNDLNVLVTNQTEAYVIDADSFQFGPFTCKVFTARFVDPLRCDPKATSPILNRPHTAESDWYAFAVMLMQCLLFVDPYGGVYKPSDPAKRIPHTARPLHRITVFDPEVKYPKPAIPYNVLSDELLHYFHGLFKEDKRGEFPVKLLELRWTRCASCGTEHARRACPNCATAAPGIVKEVTTVRGNVVATRIFRTTGIILFAAQQGGKLRWLYHENNQFRRENNRVVVDGALDPHIRYRLRGEATLLAQAGHIVTLSPNEPPSPLGTDNYGALPVFDANEQSRYWLQGGHLMRDGKFGPDYIGDVLSGQTLFWVGPKFGFGFYRAGNLNIGFTFDANSRGINDSVKLPAIAGQLVDSTCVFTSSRCWFFVTLQQGGKTINRCAIIRQDGSVEATAETDAGDGSWLGTIRGKCAAGNFLLAPTDEGVVRVEPDGNHISETRRFPDTEPFVDSSSNLFVGSDGLYVVGRQDITRLVIS